MSRRVMLIAPLDPDMDRTWLPVGHTRFHWIESRPAGWMVRDILSMSSAEAESMSSAEPDLQGATLRRYYHPGWRVQLWFYVDDRLNGLDGIPVLPAGYVLPGAVQGVALEWWPL